MVPIKNGVISDINPAIVKKRAERSYPGRRVHVLPAGYNSGMAGLLDGGSEVDHIDLPCLLVPSRNLLIVDQSFYNDWRSKRELAGGGIMMDQGIHMLDLFRYKKMPQTEYKE